MYIQPIYFQIILFTNIKKIIHQAMKIHGRIFFFKDFIYLLMRDTERERGRDTGRGRSSVQGAQRGTRSEVFRITPWAAGGAKPLCHGGCPSKALFIFNVYKLLTFPFESTLLSISTMSSKPFLLRSPTTYHNAKSSGQFSVLTFLDFQQHVTQLTIPSSNTFLCGF